MAPDVALYLLGTAALSSSLVAVLASALSWRALRATRARKPNTPSLAESANELASVLAAEKITHQLATLDKRLRMREQRMPDRENTRTPPPGATKAQLFKAYGFSQTGPAFAQRQLELERSGKETGDT